MKFVTEINSEGEVRSYENGVACGVGEWQLTMTEVYRKETKTSSRFCLPTNLIYFNWWEGGTFWK